MNYCDDNGCQNRKRNYVEGNDIIADVICFKSYIRLSILWGKYVNYAIYLKDGKLFFEPCSEIRGNLDYTEYCI